MNDAWRAPQKMSQKSLLGRRCLVTALPRERDDHGGMLAQWLAWQMSWVTAQPNTTTLLLTRGWVPVLPLPRAESAVSRSASPDTGSPRVPAASDAQPPRRPGPHSHRVDGKGSMNEEVQAFAVRDLDRKGPTAYSSSTICMTSRPDPLHPCPSISPSIHTYTYGYT